MAKVGTPGALPAVPATAAYLGQGLTYPPTLDTSTGRLRMSNGAQLVTEAMASIYQTAPGERAMQPDYGVNVGVFEPLNPGVVQACLQNNVNDHEARVEDIDVDESVGPGYDQQQVVIGFGIIGQATASVLTFPYTQGPSNG